MLKGAAIAVIVLASATSALADAQTECDSENAPDQTIIACSQFIKVDSRAAWAYFKRGNAYQFKGELDRAIADYGDAIAPRSEIRSRLQQPRQRLSGQRRSRSRHSRLRQG